MDINTNDILAWLDDCEEVLVAFNNTHLEEYPTVDWVRYFVKGFRPIAAVALALGGSATELLRDADQWIVN